MKHVARSYSLNSINSMKRTKPSPTSSSPCDFSALSFKLLTYDEDNGENADWEPPSPSSSRSTLNPVPPRIRVLSVSSEHSIKHTEPKSDINEPTHVKVTKLWHKNPLFDYKMSSKPRGPCLIVNNVNFDLDILPKRLGSDKDASSLKNVFEQLGFHVEIGRNLTSHKMKSFFMQASVSCRSKYDALIVIILSHGTENAIYGTDGVEMDLNDIISLFDNKRCKQMAGKPKVFIVQACRGRFADYGVRGHDMSLFHSQPESPPQSQVSQLIQSVPISPKINCLGEFDDKLQPTRTDMLLCFSCNPGYVSVRNEDTGSWLCMSLATHLRNYSCKNHFMEIINMVSQDVRRRISTEGHKQVIEITWIGFDKNLYFNPGLYD